MKFSCAALLAYLVFQASVALAQSAPPTNNVLTRMLMIESRYGRGSTFSIDVDGREYWITAKHILTGAEHPPYGSIRSKSASLSVLNPGAEGEQWLQMNFSVIDAGDDIDIAVLAPPRPLLENPLPSAATSAQVMLGGDCEFLGYPYGGGWRARWEDGRSFWMPYVKHCTVSALFNGEPRVLILDGINNAGFSGGPVIYQTGPEQKIIGVVSGYHFEPTDVISSAVKNIPVKKPGTRLKVNLNSGFIIAYDISYANEAIAKNPIGPLRKAK